MEPGAIAVGVTPGKRAGEVIMEKSTLEQLEGLWSALEPVRQIGWQDGHRAGFASAIREVEHVLLAAAVDDLPGKTREGITNTYSRYEPGLNLIRKTYPKLVSKPPTGDEETEIP